MRTRQRRLALLHEELASIDMLDRLREYAAEPDRGGYRREVCRERRAEILAQIARLRAERPWLEAHARRVSVAVLLCAATACATLYLWAR